MEDIPRNFDFVILGKFWKKKIPQLSQISYQILQSICSLHFDTLCSVYVTKWSKHLGHIWIMRWCTDGSRKSQRMDYRWLPDGSHMSHVVTKPWTVTFFTLKSGQVRGEIRRLGVLGPKIKIQKKNPYLMKSNFGSLHRVFGILPNNPQ